MSRFYVILINRAWETTLYFLYKISKSGICNSTNERRNTMSFIIQDTWQRQQINSYSDMALMYQLDMNGHSKPNFHNRDSKSMGEIADRHFGQKGVMKSTKQLTSSYLSKLWDEELDDYYYCLWADSYDWHTKTTSVKRMIEYHKDYFKLRTPTSATQQHGDWITGKTGVAFENVGVRKIVPAPFDYHKVEKQRYLEVVLGDNIRYCKADQMLSFKYDKKPKTEDQFITLPKYKVNRKKMNLIRKNFKDNEGSYFESMYKLIPETYDHIAREQSRKELKELREYDHPLLPKPHCLTEDEKKYADFLESVIDVNQGWRSEDKKVSLEKFMDYHEKNLKKYNASTILEAV